MQVKQTRNKRAGKSPDKADSNARSIEQRQVQHSIRIKGTNSPDNKTHNNIFLKYKATIDRTKRKNRKLQNHRFKFSQ